MDPRGIILMVPQMQPRFLELYLLAWEPLKPPFPAGGGMDVPGWGGWGAKIIPPPR